MGTLPSVGTTSPGDFGGISRTASSGNEPRVKLLENVKLPNLFYVGDVPVSATSSGMLLLYRLLEAYPASKLVIAESSLQSPKDRRLRDVEYRAFSAMLSRLARTRGHRIAMTLAVLSTRLVSRRLVPIMRGRRIEAVLSVPHGTSWLVADKVARALGVPLFLINHDYWFDTCPAVGISSDWLHRQFGAVYARARVRFCVSPQMAEHYRLQYGVAGTVLYPSRAAHAKLMAPLPRDVKRPFTVAYAGTITYRGYGEALHALMRALERCAGRLFIYSNLTADDARRFGLVGSNVVLHGLIPPEEVLHRLNAEADALFVPMSSAMGLNGRLSFPSKLADYTAIGVPVVVYAPRESSAYVWALETPDSTVAVEEGDAAELTERLQMLSSDPQLRMRMGEATLRNGEKYFNGVAAQRSFYAALADASV